jgi:L-asparaginase
MMEDPRTRALMPLDFQQIREHVPELSRFDLTLDVISFEEPIDSSDVTISTWQLLADIIETNYEKYDGFVVLHGTDTMAYSASALSFMLENTAKPVVFTGSQLPIGKLRTDGKENLITAIEIASARRDNAPVVQEVAVYFESSLFRGNRTHKYNTEEFDAFESANLPALAQIGIHIFFNHALLLRPNGPFCVHRSLNPNVGVLKLFPGINAGFVRGVLSSPGLRGLVVETFGSGNAPRDAWFVDALEEAIKAGLFIVNVTQCNEGFVEQGRYKTSSALSRIGVIPGADMTTEAALTKLMFLIGQGHSGDQLTRLFMAPLRGELTASSAW